MKFRGDLQRTIQIPYFKNIIHQIEIRFAATEQLSFKLQQLIPAFPGVGNYNFASLQDVLQLYSSDIDSYMAVLKGEYERWTSKWSHASRTELPRTVMEALIACDSFSFPNVHIRLRLFATLPVTTATSERSFSTLRRLLTYHGAKSIGWTGTYDYQS